MKASVFLEIISFKDRRTSSLEKRRGKTIRPLPPEVVVPVVLGVAQSEGLVDGEAARRATTNVLPVTTAWLVALAEVVLLAWAVVAAVAGVSVLESRVLVALAEALGARIESQIKS